MKSLFARLMALQIGCALLLVVILYTILDKHLTEHVNEDFVLSGHTLTEALAKHIELHLVNRDLTSIQSALDVNLSKTDVVAAYVTGPDGEVLAHTFVPNFPEALRTSRESDQVTTVEITLKERPVPVTFFSKPVLTGILGTVHIGLSQDRLLASTHRMKTLVLTSIAGVMLVITVIFAVMATRITAPIRSLTREAQRLGRDVRAEFREIPVLSHDELGSLAEAFNRMVGEIQAHASGLDQAVRETTRQLSEREAQTRLIVDNALDAVVSMNAGGLVTDWNAQAVTILGWSREEAIGQKLSTLIIPEKYRAMHDRGLQHFLATGEGPVLNKRIEIVALHRDGHEFPVELTISPVKVGGTYIFSAFLRDISQRKQAEEDLKHAKDTAEAANRAKSEFLANMSHEIRTPMNGVLGMTELLLGTELTDKQRRFAETVHKSGTSLLEVINEILDFSKIEAGKLQLETVDFDLHETVEEVMDLLADAAHSKGLELACAIPEAVPSRLRGDPGRLRQILVNLVGNALKFTERGEVVVRLALVEATSTETVLRFEVADTGIGIPQDAQAMIFHAFAQADGSTTRKFGGTGLGLAIVEQLVDMMHGHIGVQSEVGKGSTFWFTVRLASPLDPASPQSTPCPDLHGRRVLIVDDNATNRTILEHQTSGFGMKPYSVESGPQALQQLQEAAAHGTPFNLAILDYQMPDMDGLALARAIKSEPTLASLPLVMLTSVNRLNELETACDAGIRLCLTKPVRQSRLLAGLRKVLGTAESAQENPAPRAQTGPLATACDRTGLRPHPRILLAEDNLVNREVAVSMLEALGCRVDCAENGRDAVAATERAGYDLILMDCQMPEMDGFEATRRLREMEGQKIQSKTGRIPVVALTANALTGDRERCLAAGMDDYLSKPFTQAELREILTRWSPATPPGHTDRPQNDVCTPSAIATPTTPTIEYKAWDAIRLLQRKGQPDMLAKVLAMYLDNSRTLMEALRQAVPAQDAAAVREAAHSLKSSSATLGAMALAGHCKELEAMGRAQTLLQAAELLTRLEAEYAGVCEAFAEELQAGKQG